MTMTTFKQHQWKIGQKNGMSRRKKNSVW